MKRDDLLRHVLIFSIFLMLFPCACKESTKTAVPRLIEKLTAEEAHQRNEAALALAAYGEDAEPASKQLIRLLSDKNYGVRSSAAFALRRIGTKEATAALDAYTIASQKKK